MPAPDHAAPSITAETTAAARDALVGALQGLYRAFQKTSIYPAGHPAVPEAVTRAAASFAAALADHESLSVAVGRERLRLGGEELAEATGALKSLALLLHDLDVAALEFRRGVDAEELESFVRLLGEARVEGLRGATLIERFGPHEIERLGAVAVDYDALRFEEGAREAPDEESADRVWDRLSEVLTAGDPEAGDEQDDAAARLADEVGREIDRHEGTGVGHLRSKIRRLNREIGAIAPEQRDALRQRMAQFVSALNPKLRWDLLRLDPQAPGESVELLTEMVDVLPETDLLEALQEIDRVGARVPGELMTLMNKLVRISHTRPSLSNGLRDTLAKWGVADAALTADAGDLRAALAEVFQRRTRFHANPEPYQHLLDDLSRGHIDGDYEGYADRYRDSRDIDDVRIHAAELAVRLVGAREGGHFRPGILGYVATVASSLIDEGRFDLLQDAAVAARACTSLASEPDSSRTAAAGFLGEFASDFRVGRILTRIVRSRSVPEAALSLLHLGGARATDGIVDVLSKEPPPEVRRALFEFVAARPATELQPALDARLDRGTTAVRALLPLIRRLPVTAALPMLERLCRHSDEQVRREALSGLCDVERRPEVLEHWLRRGLRDRKLSVATVAVQRLGEVEGARALDLLADYVACRVDGIESNPALGRLAADALLRRGEEGRRRAIAAVGQLVGSVTPRKVAMALAVASLLEAHRADPEVGRLVRRMRWSLTGLLMRLWPRRGTRRSEAVE